MIFMFWDKYFTPVILERGYNYFTDGFVTSVKKTGSRFTGIVSGTEDYIVKINVIDTEGSISLVMDCTCPYAEDGNYCKHMAALLYAIENEDEYDEIDGERNDSETNATGPSSNQVNSKQELVEIVDGLCVDTVRKELIRILENDEGLCTQFVMRYAKNTESIKDYINNKREAAKTIFRQSSDRHGFVDWRNASTYTSRLVNEVLAELHDFASPDIEEAKAAFDVSLYVYGLFAGTDMDDSGGETQYFTDECLDLWSEILEFSKDNDLAKYMLDKLNHESNTIGVGEYMSEMIDEFVSGHFTDKGFMTTKLEVIDAKIERFENDKSWSGEYNLSKCIKERISIMMSLGCSEDEIIAFRKRYRYLSAIREIEMDEFEAAGNLNELTKLLEESKEIDKKLPGLIQKYSKRLVKCYNDNGYYSKAKDELFLYLTEYRLGDIEAFIELRSSLDKERWQHKREEIFRILTEKRVNIMPLMAEEGLKERLFELLNNEAINRHGVRRNIVAMLKEYENVLRPDYDQELLDMYRKEILKMAEHAGGRGHYQDIVAAIMLMFPYPNGKIIAEEIVQHCRLYYPNRPAMQDELSALYTYLRRP
jgi:hypothetical protein